MLSPGQVLDGRYEIVAPIAEGGMGAVYRARRVHLGDEVAIKVILGDQAGSAARDRFLRESRACARLRHPNIVSIFDFDIDPDGNPFLVMELLSGPSLKEELAVRGRLEVAEIQRIIPPVCRALHMAHTHGIVHRDLKPANIVAHRFGQEECAYKVVDFGVAAMRETTDDTRLTGAHQFLGTIRYASPEQLTGAGMDARSDVYSLATVVFEMLTGRVPFEGSDQLAIVTSLLSTRAPSLDSVRPGLPSWIDVAIGRALEKRPEDRWNSVAEFGAILEEGAGEATGVGPVVATSPLAAYDVGERIGPGRLGSEVFSGVHRALQHRVAIRILRRRGHSNWDALRARFLREAQSLQIAHPSIIQVRDYGEEPDLIYVVTDFVPGVSLRQFVEENGPVAWPRLRPLLGQLVEAARALHRRNALLCGLNPEIMRVTPAGAEEDEPERLMISTAGICHAQDLLATLQEQTLRGQAVADPELRYVAPELLTGQPADLRSDVFTMGVLAYEMATGRVPFEAGSMPGLLGAMLGGGVPDPRVLQPTLPESTAGAIVRALRPRPEDRFQTAREFGAALGVRS